MEIENDRLITGMQIGDYLLTALLYDGPTTRTWLAKQVSINREVVVDSLNLEQQQDELFVSTFIGDVRAKAAVDFPLIGSVFEAVRDERLCFYAREKLNGSSLAGFLENSFTLSPRDVAHILRQLAEANLYLEEHNTATLPIQPDQILISEYSLCRMVNMAIGGERDHTVSTTDKYCIGNALIPLLETGQVGSTRTRSLLDFMADQTRETPLEWEQIRSLAEGIELHISTPTESLAQKNATQRLQRRGRNKKLITFAITASVLGIAAYGVTQMINQPEKPTERILDSMVHIPAGNYVNHDGNSVDLEEFWIDAHEVTIAEYSKFLDAVDILNADQVAVYQHSDQPKDKASHQPDDWSELKAAATNGANWNGKKIDPNHPVIGVDFWDAYAYSSFKRCELPSTTQWHSVLHYFRKDKPLTSQSGWGAVDQKSKDITGSVIHGLAGNVSEWSSSMSKDPGSPTKPKMPVLLGGSFLLPHSSATSREWLNGDSRSTRRPDLGFRTISSSAPSE